MSNPTTDYSPPCVKCTGVNGAHYLTCPTINLTPGWYERMLRQQGEEQEWDI